MVIVRLEGGKVAREHIYWDQGSVLVQAGLIDPKGLPLAGAEVAAKRPDIAEQHADQNARASILIERVLHQVAVGHRDPSHYRHNLTLATELRRPVQVWLARPERRIKPHFIPSYCPTWIQSFAVGA